jgi:molybdopterin-guanine dinucleotide biosynthesis protein A
MFETRTTPIVLGVFVGGASRRMNGYPKGLLRAPNGQPLVERWRALAEQLHIACVLVGNAQAYGAFGIEAIADAETGKGPLGGLVGLLRNRAEPHILAVACDMPYVTAPLLDRLARAPATGAALAPCREGRYEPLFARYDRDRVLPVAERRLAASDHSLQGLLKEIDAEPFELTAAEWELLRDWDEPGDLTSADRHE